ncbi:MAG: HU family DNA-binding protein [Candidatus Pacebacteria bacterium]|jgi:DNA-binding protein HU-beta|nr:HU family DNA-binding protein [Candidatus Paceibacterota bacterium]
MQKSELAEAIAKKTGLSKRQAEESLNVVIGEIEKTLSKGGEVVLTGFGKFHVVNRKAREGINPKTGEKIKIPAQKVPKFKAGKALKDSVK